MHSYSFSQLQSYRRCPYQYKLTYIAKLPRQGSAGMSFGISIHSTLQAFYNKVKELNTQSQASLFGQVDTQDSVQSNLCVPTKSFLLNLFEQKFVEAWYDTPEEINKMKQHGQEILSGYYENKMGKWLLPLENEAGFNLKIEKVLVKGKIDKIDITPDGLAIVDYKSGRKPDILTEEDKQQLYIYQLATACLPKFKHYGDTVSLKYVYLGSGDEYEFIGSASELELTKRMIIEIDKNISKSSFEATPSKDICKKCPYRSSCEFSLYTTNE